MSLQLADWSELPIAVAVASSEQSVQLAVGDGHLPRVRTSTLLPRLAEVSYSRGPGRKHGMTCDTSMAVAPGLNCPHPTLGGACAGQGWLWRYPPI